MDRDETRMKYALEFTQALSGKVRLPVVAYGGSGNLEHYCARVV
jgi:imidazole glycerol phosphate synthase subunit HisF